jgi:hypothetical protein
MFIKSDRVLRLGFSNDIATASPNRVSMLLSNRLMTLKLQCALHVRLCEKTAEECEDKCSRILVWYGLMVEPMYVALHVLHVHLYTTLLLKHSLLEILHHLIVQLGEEAKFCDATVRRLVPL